MLPGIRSENAEQRARQLIVPDRRFEYGRELRGADARHRFAALLGCHAQDARRLHHRRGETLRERQRLQPELLIIDVRSAAEYRGELGHIATASLLPLPEFTTGLAQLDGGPQRPVVLVCRTDKRSADAARLMDAAGWQQVSVLSGGMEAWQRAGLPVER